MSPGALANRRRQYDRGHSSENAQSGAPLAGKPEKRGDASMSWDLHPRLSNSVPSALDCATSKLARRANIGTQRGTVQLVYVSKRVSHL